MNKLLVIRKKLSKGFTLIELLIVIAVIGVLAAVILVAIDPIEQLARGRDAGRKSSVTQLGRALQAYYTNNSQYPGAAWDTDLVNQGDIRVFPNANPFTADPPCAGGVVVNRFCYKVVATAPTNIVVYTFMESKSEKTKFPTCAAAIPRLYIYVSRDGRAGTICQATEPTPNQVAPFDYL